VPASSDLGPSPQRGESAGSGMPPACPEQRGALFTRHWARSRSEWEGEGLRPSRRELLERARLMRSNPTEAERRLWSLLRHRRLGMHKFKRQQVLFPYIVDFICPSAGLIVEADGSQHIESAYDARRDAALRGRGFRVLRFWNNDVLADADAVANAIYAELAHPHPPTASRRAPPSPLQGEGLEGATRA
jgi:very-short-patch-repair endonuclease